MTNPQPIVPSSATDPAGAAEKAARMLAAASGVSEHDVAVVMGSGWRPAADVLGSPDHELSVTELPGFLPPTVAGHAGVVRSLRLTGPDGVERRVLVFLGRTHLYEAGGVASVVHAVRTAITAGVKVVVLTNAAGGLDPAYSVGQPVLISDHINLTAVSPLVGARFVDLTDLYSPRLRALARGLDPTLTEGVYAGLPGPHFETPAEIRMLRTMGADLVGMSTTLEAIAARAEGAEVLGISLVTNLAAGMTGAPLDHIEVLEAGQASAARMGELLRRLLSAL